MPNAGISDDLSSGEAKRIRLVNRVAIIVGILIFPFVFVYAELGLDFAVVVQFITGLILFSSPILNYRKRYILARFNLLLSGLTNIFLTSSIMGLESGEHTALILAILLAFMLFDLRKQKGWLWLGIALTLGCWLVLVVTDHQIFGTFLTDHGADRANYYSNFTFTLFISGLIAYSFQGLSNRQVDEIVVRAQRELQAVFDNSYDAILLVDLGSHVISGCNLRSVEMFGVANRENLIGKPLNPLFLHTSSKEKQARIAARLLNGERWSDEDQFQDQQGNSFWGNVAYTFIQYGDKRELLVRITDISKKKEAEAAIIEAKERAEEASRAKDNFLANMSHEFRTPINGIIGLAEIIGIEAEEAEVQSYADLVLESGRRLLSTLGSVLDLSRLESQDYKLLVQSVSVNQMIQKATQELLSEFERKELYFQTTLLQPDRLITINEEYTIICLQHLLTNALKFTLEGGVTLWIEGPENHQGFVSIHLADTGIGMSQAFLEEKLFQKFEQESDGLSRNFEGSGLGLSIVQRAIELMKGKIEVQSQKGEGSTFSIFLPVATHDTNASSQPNLLASSEKLWKPNH